MARTVLATIFGIVLSVVLSTAAFSQTAPAPDRSATGGAQTLQDILARQRGEAVGDAAPASPADGGDFSTSPLSTRGGASDPDLWRAYRFGVANITTQARGPAADVVMQDSGMWWLDFRRGPLLKFTTYLMGGTLVLLALFFLVRGRIRIDGKKTGQKITRFKAIERFGHWLMAGSFILLGLTGLISLFGRKVMIPMFGHESFSTLAIGSKWIHNNMSWAFMLGLIMVFVMWVAHNIPNRTDLVWIAKGGGIFKKGVHPPAGKFNAGQKLIFWAVILLGASISVTGLSLLFPFELPMFGKTFVILNATGLPQLFGFGELNTVLAPHQEMQFAQLWHALVSVVLLSIVLAHIYIGTVGMEGAYDAMGSGDVEEQWAREHHSLWVDQVKSADSPRVASVKPAE